MDKHHTKELTHTMGPGEHRLHFFRGCGGRDVEVIRLESKQAITNAATGEVGLMACRLKRGRDLRRGLFQIFCIAFAQSPSPASSSA